jgi:hypothetical protein
MAFKNFPLERIVIKRELSEISKHVIKADIDSIPKLPGRDKDGGFRWMVQHRVSEFDEHHEMRMFVIDGRCRWGVATRCSSPDGTEGVIVETNPVAVGRRMWTEGGQEAADLAERIVSALCTTQAHVGRFLRVDMMVD